MEETIRDSAATLFKYKLVPSTEEVVQSHQRAKIKRSVALAAVVGVTAYFVARRYGAFK